MKSWLGCAMATLFFVGVLCADALLPNGGFEQGRDQPTGWHLIGLHGRRVASAHEGRSAVMVDGNGNDESFWRTEGIALKPGSLYRLSFDARQENAAGGGAAIAGLSRVNRDFRLSDPWNRYSFVFMVPAGATNDYVRLGQWHAKGQLFFSDAELDPVVAIHSQFANGLELGEGESVRGGTYRFRPNYGWPGANGHRPLLVNRAGFNSDRWLFSPGAEIVYRLRATGSSQRHAKVYVAINYYRAGALLLDASRDNKSWVSLSSFDGRHQSGWSELPESLFPAQQIFIRLSCKGTNANFQVNSFEYESPLTGPLPDVEGATDFMDVLHRVEGVGLSLSEFKSMNESLLRQFTLSLTNATDSTLTVSGTLDLDSVPGPPIELHVVRPNSSTRWTVVIPEREPGEHLLNLQLRHKEVVKLFAGRAAILGSVLADPRAGYWLPGPQELDVWWCEGGWKTGRERQPPQKPSVNDWKPIGLTAARGEYEPVQVILRPEKDGELTSVDVAPFRDSSGEKGSISARFSEVVYLQVTQPSDTASARGWYPDPLQPLKTPLVLRGGQNQPLWITFYVAPDSKAGDSRGALLLETTFGKISLPVTVHVYGFTLPQQTHLRSALGVTPGAVNQFHRLRRPEDKERVYEKYLLNFAEHRLSPLSFYDYAPLDVQFIGEATNKHVRIDFERFDQAATNWLDNYHFTAFRVPLLGMGSGTFEHRHPGELGGFNQGTSQYDALLRDYLSQVEFHLRGHQWLDKAYAYWFDEPKPQDYDFVAAGMDRIRTAAPGLRRMVTVTPDPRLIGHVDIWCGLTHKWTHAQMSERRLAGDEIWWYICTVPKAPYVTEFIDHPGTELRLWPWQSWQYGVSGILVWNTIYWSSSLVYPEPGSQDPWTDPMSYVSGYGFPVGYVGTWGNGDGRFLYPPRAGAGKSAGPILEGPVNSLRWENLRDGMEDYEYFWLLQQAIERAAAAGGKSGLLTEARLLLVVPPDVSKDLTHFTTDPRPLLEHRDRIARMIEELLKVTGNEP